MERSDLMIMTILGTRPEIIRLPRIMSLPDQYVDHIIVHAGQNYDYELNEVFFNDLDLRKLDHFLKVDTSSLGTVLGDTLIKIESVLKEEGADAVLILEILTALSLASWLNVSRPQSITWRSAIGALISTYPKR